jgi:galactose mutarotase-like enzyme
MGSLSNQPSGEAGVGQLLVLSDEKAGSSVTIAPKRGALVTSFQVDGRELFYLDRETLRDPSKNVRGGNPVLFPSPGKLAGDRYSAAGQSGAMKQHGFARNCAFEADRLSGEGATVKLTLNSDSETLAQYPWPFRFELEFSLSGHGLHISSRVTNLGSSSMPFALGYHPYFRVTDKAAASIEAQGTRAFDNVTKHILPFTGFDLTASELDLHLLDNPRPYAALHYGDGKKLGVRTSADFSAWIVWTLTGKDYVCLEPWTALGDALNTGDRLSVLEAGAARSAWVEFTLEDAS